MAFILHKVTPRERVYALGPLPHPWLHQMLRLGSFRLGLVRKHLRPQALGWGGQCPHLLEVNEKVGREAKATLMAAGS